MIFHCKLSHRVRNDFNSQYLSNFFSILCYNFCSVCSKKTPYVLQIDNNRGNNV